MRTRLDPGAILSSLYLIVLSATAAACGAPLGEEESAENLHVFSPGCVEIDRMLRFRDRLRTDDDDRAIYERTKRALAAREWKYVQHYADAKSEVVEAILDRARRDHGD